MADSTKKSAPQKSLTRVDEVSDEGDDHPEHESTVSPAGEPITHSKSAALTVQSSRGHLSASHSDIDIIGVSSSGAQRMTTKEEIDEMLAKTRQRITSFKAKREERAARLSSLKQDFMQLKRQMVQLSRDQQHAVYCATRQLGMYDS
ncbi:unnamed protein product [Vitrella brassicaformis CCMP3155]|uniref:Uncharacterized protein n=1 Tax=Vitrella brassicaformis (strain CCMP3155) TaxID=1169540 RepID=A0A0G4EAV6_VITBC|nr:unnamed protein product [Vitrella brassicaformis CCMP3155]|mmetsp:Transcript_45345/g.112627  ORF Transcript_45345/g.112627 Transcript_45345/m.112627 type:complete len:147 (-) Transcript_45345:342-782(-)|eukprot:CEL92798.1 unnamed protein product [Vitrella brassicaformis CCMP3155]